MGQVCVSEEDRQRLEELEDYLKEQESEKAQLRQKIEEARAAQEANKPRDGETYSSEKIEQLQNEKRQLHKTMLKEKKHTAQLENEIEKYKKQMEQIESDMKAVKKEKTQKDRARKRKEEKEKMKKENARLKKERAAKMKLKRERDAAEIKKERDKDPFAGLGTGLGAGLGAGLGSVMDGIKIPNLGDLNIAASLRIPGWRNESAAQTGPFKVKEKELTSVSPSSTDDGDESTDSDDSKFQTFEMKDTILLDSGYDAESEATHLYSWLHGQDADKLAAKNKKAVKQLKHRLASLLTSRSEGYRQTLIQAYRAQYNLNLEKDIKKVIVKGHAMQIIHGLLMTRAQYDAILISECVANWDIEPVADIICCRSLVQLRELHDAYKKKCKLDVRKQLQALAQKDKKKTLVKVIGGILDSKRKELANVDMNSVNSDLNFILTTKNFKGETKERLVMVFTVNSVQYIKVLNDQFKLKSKDSLTVFMDKKLGPKSTAGLFCKTRILYALDTPVYYAQKIKKLGFQFKKNKKKIADIFIQRMETDLAVIKRVWKVKKYDDGKDLREWIVSKSSGSKAGFFLCKMLDNCGRYAEFNKMNSPQNKKPGGMSKFEKMMM